MAKLAENIAKYGDAASDDKTVKGALFRMAGRIGEVAQENPEAAGFYVSSNAIGAKQLLSAATYVNNKIASSEAKGEMITPEQLLSWGKQGAALQAVSTVVNTVETVMPESDAKDTKKDSEQTTADTTKNMTNAEKTAYFSQLADDALHVDDLVSGSAETSLQQVE